MKWLLIGTGDIVRKRVAGALGGQIVGICGGRARAEALAKQHNIAQVYDDMGDALRQTDADAVYVATPVYRHSAEAVAALEAGKHVLIEKPLAVSAPDAQRIIDAQKRSGRTAGCAFYRRCYARYEHLRGLINDGTLGDIVHVRMSCWSWFSPAVDDPKYWRVDPALSGGGPLADMGSHMFDLIIGLFGLPRLVFAQLGTLANDYKVEDSAAVVMTLDNGAHVVASFGWNSKSWRHDLEVVGVEGKTLWHPFDAGPVTVTIGRDTQQVDLPNDENVHGPLVRDFERAVASGSEPICSIDEAVKTNRLLDAIYQSARTNLPVELSV